MAIGADIWEAFKVIVASPFTDFSVWWYLGPILILWFLLEIYFGKYKKEKLGWNTALGNGVSLTWINIEAMRYLFSLQLGDFWLRFLVLAIVMIYGFFVIYISFTHKFKPAVTYSLAAPTPIYFLSVVVTLWGHGNLTLSLWVLVDLILLFILALLFFIVVKKLLPGKEEGELGAEEEKLTGGIGEAGSIGGESLGKDLGGEKELKDLKL